MPSYSSESRKMAFFISKPGGDHGGRRDVGDLALFPQSPVHRVISYFFSQQVLMALGMGLTVRAVVCSPWGRRSGEQLFLYLYIIYYHFYILLSFLYLYLFTATYLLLHYIYLIIFIFI